MRKLKTVQILVEIPAEYKWKAQDSDGVWSVFTHKPIAHNRMWVARGKSMTVGKGNPNPNWRDTLEPVCEYEEAA